MRRKHALATGSVKYTYITPPELPTAADYWHRKDDEPVPLLPLHAPNMPTYHGYEHLEPTPDTKRSAFASLGWVKLRPGDPVRIDPPVRGYNEGVLADLTPYHAAIVTDDGMRSLVDTSRLSRLETASFASSDGSKVLWWALGIGIVAWWLWPDSDLTTTEQLALAANGVVWSPPGAPTPPAAVGLIEGTWNPVTQAIGNIRSVRLAKIGYHFWSTGPTTSQKG